MLTSGDKMPLHDTLRSVLMETADAYRALNEDNLDAVFKSLKSIEQYVANYTERTNKLSQEEQARADWLSHLSSKCPDGYETILMYSIRTGRYDTHGCVDDYVRDSLIDSRSLRTWLRSSRTDVKAMKVEAPELLRDGGIESINAYPTNILEAALDI